MALSVDELRERVAAAPELNVLDIDLRNEVELRIRFETSTSEAAGGLLDPSGTPIGGGMVVPTIGTLRSEAFILKLDCTDWDSQPPTAELLDSDGNPLPSERWPHDKSGRGIVQGHPTFGDRKFFCREGTREFHTHPQHEDHPWDRYREGMTLYGIVIGLLQDLTHRWTFR